MRGVPRYSPRYWTAGVFVYNPPPPRHEVVVVQQSPSGGTQVVQDAPAPTRAVDRRGDFGIGVTGGSYMSGYEGGGGYGDLGLGLTARFRPVDAIGFEASWSHHAQNWNGLTERSNNPFQASAQLFAFPWTKVSPYVTTGLTWNNRQLADLWVNDDTGMQELTQRTDTQFGAHLGLGMEFAIGDSAALNLDARYIGWMNQDLEDPSAPGALQTNAGLVFYF